MKTAMNMLLGAMLFLGARSATAPSAAVAHAGNGQRPAAHTFASLPLAAQASLSAALGHDPAGYQIRSQNGSLQAANDQHRLAVAFTSEGVAVRHGGASLGLALQGYGYAGDLAPVREAVPAASANRVEYRRGPLTEWYVNGPAGIEQGFTLAAPPNRAHRQPAGQPLQVALALSGDFRATVDEARKSLTLTARGQLAPLRYAGLTAIDATGTELPVWFDLRGPQLLIEVADNTARYPITIDPLFQVAKLTASDGAAFDNLGPVAISGNTLVAGAAQMPSGGPGTAYIFVKPASGWANMTQTAKLTASDAVASDRFGTYVAISGSTVVVGALTALGSNSKQSAAYVFVKPASGWANMTQTAKLTASDGAMSGSFPFNVSVNRDTIAAGAVWAQVGSNQKQGAAYVFVRPASGWANMTQTAKLTASDGAAQDLLGTGLGVAGRVVVAGAENATIGSSQFQGAAYVFVEPATGWTNMTQTAKLTASDGNAGDGFGSSAAISGNTLAVGAFGASGASGAAYVFVKPAGGWVNTTQTAILTALIRSSAAELGSSISMSTSGNIVVAGAPGQQVHFNEGQGAVFIFVKPASGWADMTENRQLAASDGAAGDLLGASVSISGTTVVAGAFDAKIGANTWQGAVYVFVP